MEQESIPRQVASGAAFGVVLGMATMLRSGRPLFSAPGIGALAGWAVGGAVLYAALRLIWPQDAD